MSASWLFTDYPASRSVIENDLRLVCWRAGLKRMWISCVKETPPYECQADWRGEAFVIEWEPKKYLRLKMPAPNQDLLEAFERILKHPALAAYKNGAGQVIVEWYVGNADSRFAELEASGVRALQRLDR